LNPKKEESLKRYHPWVFSGAIHHTDSPLEEGETVDVYDFDNHFLAAGHCQIGSIAVRLLTFRQEKNRRRILEKTAGNRLSFAPTIGISQ